ncbi:hypothetical protein FXV77_14275 [Sphingobacterium phlebotomi]|uniref:Tetratricopeptide repeat protein n=1 Tax=Sphingobacterium phlebotomi TaxID=2605433 RepID=A0A5D4H367_9SPHI|nr:hypothetical protein [Sphingobacterium phlebotomi]TYR35108.1 hypothetical protein FXV77_14275 [Sphingobacterium phlebotomi]
MTDKYQDLIDDYLRDRLSEEQRREVERLAEADEDFRAELDFHRQTKSAFAKQKHDQLKKRLQSLSSETPKPLIAEHSTNRFGRLFWLVAATVLLICSIGFYMWSMRQSAKNPADLYMAYFEPYPNVVLPITRDEVQLDDRALAYSYYEQADYAKAYELFGSLSEDVHADDPEVLFYKGISALQLDLNGEATRLLNTYQSDGTAKLGRQAKWYEALAHLKQGDKKEAQKLLQSLADHQGYKQQEATSLLKEY